VGSGVSWLLAFTLLQGPAPPQPNLSLVLTCGAQPNDVRLSIHNSDQTDTAILLGIAVANGRWYVPRELVIELRRIGSTEVEELVYKGPTSIAGRIDHWVVALPVQAAFTLTLRAADFITTSSAQAVSPPDELKVRFTGRPITADLNVDMTGMKTWRVWTGTASSNTLRLSDCSR
jgi:hypothetical protein